MIFSLQSSQRFWYINGEYLCFGKCFSFPSYSISFSCNGYFTLCLLVYQVLYSVYSQFCKVLTLCRFFVKSDGSQKIEILLGPNSQLANHVLTFHELFPTLNACVSTYSIYRIYNIYSIYVQYLQYLRTINTYIYGTVSPAPQSNGHWTYRGHTNHTRWQLRISIDVKYLQYLQYLQYLRTVSAIFTFSFYVST